MSGAPRFGDNCGPALDDDEGPEWGDGDPYVYFNWKSAHRKAWKPASRDMAAGETFQFKVFGAANENRWTHYIAGLKSGVWTPVVLRYPVTVSESVHLALSMLLDSGTTHTAIVTNHDDFVVSINGPLTGSPRRFKR